MTFNLMHEPWIPVLRGGTQVDVSLRQALVEADDIDGLAWGAPMEAVAVFRQVLLALYLDLAGLPRSEAEWGRRWQRGRFDLDTLDPYLREYGDRFDLFHPLQPFGQVARLATATGEVKPVSLLDPAVATGNNVPLFSARTDADPPALAPAQAARALLSALCWDTAAIKGGAVGDPAVKAGKTTGNPTGPVGQLGVLLPEGASLFQTLMLNTPVVSGGTRPEDRPQWRAAPPGAAWGVRPALGLLDLLTWPARRIRLVPEPGAGSTVVRGVVLTAGDRLATIPDEEPHTAWKRADKRAAGESPRRPVRHQAGRGLWRGMDALLATKTPTEDGRSTSLLVAQVADLREEGHLPADLALQVRAVGVVYGTQSAVVDDTIFDSLPLPVLALVADSDVRRILLGVVAQARDLQLAANRLGDDLRRAAGGEKLPWDRGSRIGDVLIQRLTVPVRRLLAGLQREPERAWDGQDAWAAAARELALVIVEPVVAAVPPSAFRGHAGEFIPWVAVERYHRELTRVLGPTLEVAQSVEVVS